MGQQLGDRGSGPAERRQWLGLGRSRESRKEEMDARMGPRGSATSTGHDVGRWLSGRVHLRASAEFRMAPEEIPFGRAL